jgi:hypothetical protein
MRLYKMSIILYVSLVTPPGHNILDNIFRIKLCTDLIKPHEVSRPLDVLCWKIHRENIFNTTAYVVK